MGRPLPETGTDAEEVLRDLVRDVEGGLVGSTTGRFFGWVIGGTMRVMRVSVCNWRTTDGDVEQTLAAVRRALVAARA
ncbi:MAG TPA: hypothetical protein VKW09_11270 [bacterium]|nr:hypothetical protein [bacterium]